MTTLLTSNPAYLLAFLCSIGGFIGFARKQSWSSLGAGVFVGFLYAIAGVLIQQNAKFGYETALVASTLLMGSSIPRALIAKKPVPIILATCGTLALAYYSRKLADNRSVVS